VNLYTKRVEIRRNPFGMVRLVGKPSLFHGGFSVSESINFGESAS
jgi:hypothetical protein